MYIVIIFVKLQYRMMAVASIKYISFFRSLVMSDADLEILM